MIYRMIVNPKIRYRYNNGWEYSEDGEIWYFTQRSTDEVMNMCVSELTEDSNEEREMDELLELFGDTLDEPLPDDFIAMIS